MHALNLEPEMEEFLLRLAPELAEHLVGATDAEIAEIEGIAGRPLPKFYRWFLTRMGHSMGPLAYPTLDLSAPTVLRCHAEGLLTGDPQFFMIGHESDRAMPLHVLYDLDQNARDDCLVTSSHARGGERYDRFETLREMLAWGCFSRLRILAAPQRCRGTLVASDEGDVLTRLEPVLRDLGFTTPIPTGPYCGLYEGSHAGLLTSAPLGETPDVHAFRIGGNDPGRLRRILGEIATATDLELEIDEWNPPLV